MERIKVGVKVRPLIPREKASGCDVHWRAVSDNSVSQIEPATGRPKGEPHTFDHVFGPESSNTEVFEVLVKPIVESAVKGFNGTIFAYGQTASGKTYTMMGDQYEPGIIPQAVNLIFNTIENSHGREFLLRVCYMEIYNEKIHDLLCKSNRNLKISEDNAGNVFVKDLEETITSSSQMVMDLMKRGETIRKIGVTNMNERSSRSHSIFRVIIESRAADSETDEAIQVSHLNLVDLAGSERAGATGSVGDQFKEGCAINKSLFTLGKVIAQLSEGQSSYVNFRDSKLTRILQSSLGGNALTAIVCAVTPAALEETSSTLGFASRARNIQNTAQVNEVLTERALLKRYIKQINRLKSEISSIEEEKNAENQQLQIQNSLLQERLSRLKDALLVSNPEDAVQSESHEQKMKKLRRRTWSAPNRNVSRLSLAFPMTKKKTESVSALHDIKEEDSRLSISSLKSDLDESMFATPLEEFEKALMKAEREKSIDWLPSADFVEDDTFSKSVEDEIENTPAPNYVQTRRNRGHFRLDDDFVTETPPAKLRAKIRDVEKELEEINEFTKLEKQMFDESLIEENKALTSEIRRLERELQDYRAQCESLQEIKKYQEDLKLSDRNSHDLQVLLLDTTKEVSKLNDEKKELSKKLFDAEAQCADLGKIKEDLASMNKELSDSRKEKLLLKTSLAKQEEQMRLLQNGKDDFDFQFEIMRRNYEKRIKDLTQALEDARHETNTPQHVMRHYDNSVLYSLPEETTHDELVQQLESKQERISDLEHQLSVLSTSFSAKTATEEELSAAKKLIIINCPDVECKFDDGLIPLVENLISSAKVAQEEYKSLEERMNLLQKDQGELLSSFAEVKSSLAVLEDEKQACVTELAIAQSEIEKMTTTNNELMEELTSKDSDVAKHAVEIQSLLDRISVLESSATQMEPELKQTSDSNLDISNQITHFQEEIKSLKVENDLLKENLANKEGDMAAVMKLLITHFSEMDHSFDESLIPLVENLISSAKVAQEEYKSLEERMNLLQKDQGELLSSFAEVKSSLAVLEDEKQACVTELAIAQSEIEKMTTTNNELMEELTSKDSDVAKHAVEIQSLLDRISVLESSATQMEPELKQTSDINMHLSLPSEVTLCNEEVKSLQNQNNLLKEALASKEEVILLSATELEALKSQLNDLINSSEPHLNSSKLVLHDTNCQKCMELDEKLCAAKSLLCNSIDDLNCDESITLDSLIQLLTISLKDTREKCILLEQSSEVCDKNFKSKAVELEELHERYSKSQEELHAIRGMLSHIKDFDDVNNMSLVLMVEKLLSRLEGSETENSVSKEASVLSSSGVGAGASTQCLDASHVEANTNIELECLQHEIISLKNANDILAGELEAKELNIKKSAVEMEQLRERIVSLESALISKDHASNESHEDVPTTQFSVQNEIENLEKINKNLLSDLDKKDKLVNEAAVEMEHLREQIVILECVKSANSGNPVNDMDSRSFDSEKQLQSMVQFDGDHMNELKVLQERCHVAEEELRVVRSMLCQRDEDVNKNTPLTSLIADLVESCAKNVVAGSENIKVPGVIEETEALMEHEIKIDELVSTKNSLMSELDCKNSLLADTEVELKQLKERVLELINKPATEPNLSEQLLHHKNEVIMLKSEKEALEVELQTKDAVIKESQLELVQIQDLLKMLQGGGVTEECCQKCAVFSNELASSQKLLSSELNDIELNEKASIPDLVERILVLFHRVNEECAELKQEVLKETNSKLSIQEHVNTLQKQCDSLQNEIYNTRQTLLTELKGMSDNRNFDDLPLSSVVSEFLQSVILAQQRVASILQQKVDDSSKELEATSQRENECQMIIEELRSEVKHYIAKNESLKEALEDLKQEEHDTHALVGTLNRLKILVNAVESISNDELILIFENKLLTLRSKSDEIEHLQLEVQQHIAENDILRASISALQKQVSEQRDVIVNLEVGAENAKQAITINKQKLEKLKEETSNERSQAEDWRMELVQKEELVVELERQLSELQKKLDDRSGDTALISDLKADITTKEEELLELESKLRDLSDNLTEERSKSDNLSEEVVRKQDLVVKLERQLSELQQKLDGRSGDTALISDLKADITTKEEELLELESKLRELSDNLTEERSKSDNLSEEVVREQDLVVKLERQLSELQQKLDDRSGDTALISDLKAEITTKEEALLQLESELRELSDNLTEERTKSGKLSQELLKEGHLVDDLRKELMSKSKLTEELEEEMSKVQQNLQAQIKLVAGKDLLHSKATSLYNELTEKKELISRLESDLSAKTSLIHEKETTIESLQKCMEELDKNTNMLQSELLKSKAEKELALKNLALKSSVTPTEAVQELKAENEFLKQQHEEVLKSSRDMRTRNRKLQVEINKLKEKLEEDKKSTSGALTEVSLLRSQLNEEICRREQLESELDQISKLERSKPSRVSELQKKRASLDVKHSKEEIENLKSKEELYKIEITSKSQDLTNLKKIVKEKEEMIAQLLDCPKCKDNLDKIAELDKEKSDLDKECEDLLSWGRSHEQNYNELVDKFAELLKILAETRLQLTKVAIGKIQLLSNLCKESVSALDRVTAERVEMQLSAKEIAARSANGRTADFSKKIQEATCNVILLENLCADLKKESDSVLNIVDESLTIWKKLPNQKPKTFKCTECSALSEWGKKEEAKVIKLENLVSQLEEKIKLLEHEKKPFNTRSSRRKQVEHGEEERSNALCSDCISLKEVLQSQKSEIADKNAEIVHLKLSQQLQNKPFEETVKRLESQILRIKDENTSLKSEMRRTVNKYETTVRETSRKTSKVNIATQTTESTSDIYRSQYWSGAPSGIVEEANKAMFESKVKKLEQEKEAYKALCVKRKERIEYLEQERIKNFNKENQENDEPNKSTYFTRSRKNN
ncbi:centromere-associated protein E isoform X2 [Thrips palmi]|uniref:Centromere-associated protein E isoform X2 n=1 Tax=Thrips palmi TaxID=161013 RepID=A0A6P8XZ50_THRPL|nr:centromere-associated protein E isoform X2 [Thrips palmi]